MPKVLNVDKLEKKFKTLSRSRESIQGLSSWIMHHKEVCQEIADQWLIGLSKKFNTLAMFYVANEVIQSCGKKKCPEFREAFSNVLVKAASLENVKEIKKEIFRLLKLWKERNIYDEDFSQRIEDRLNSTVIEESSSSEEEELTEQEIIAQYKVIVKKQNLFDQLEKLKSLECEVREKEEILSYADVPEMPELDDLIVRMDCQDMLKKCDIFHALVTECSELVRKEISLRKLVLKELNTNSVFYTAQQRDVKEVANAFRVYGKRVKVMETRLLEKMSTFPSPVITDSPCFSEDNISLSPSAGISPYDMDDMSSASKSTPRIPHSPINELSQGSFSGVSSMKQGNSFLGEIPKEAMNEVCESVVKPSQNSKTELGSTSFVGLTEFNLDKVSELLKEINLPTQSISSKHSILDQQKKNTLLNETSISDKETHDLEDEDVIKIKSIPLKESKSFQVKETPFSEKEIKMSSDEKIKICPDEHIIVLNQQAEDISDKTTISAQNTSISNKKVETITAQQESVNSIQQTEIIPNQHTKQQAKEPAEQINTLCPESTPNQQETKGQGLSKDNADVDFLLEEAYDNKKSKANLSYKRKIEFLLKSKGKKPCKDTHSENILESESLNVNSPVLNSPLEVQSTTEVTEIDIDKMGTNSGQMEINQSKSTLKADCEATELPGESEELSTVPAVADLKTGEIANVSATERLSFEQKIDQTSILFESFTDNLKHCDQPFNVNSTFTGSVLCSDNLTQSKEEILSFNPCDTFTGSDLSSYVSGMSTDFLKNILKKNQQNIVMDSHYNCDEKSSVTLPSKDKLDAPSQNIISNTVSSSNLDNLKTTEVSKQETSTKEDNFALLDSKNNLLNSMPVTTKTQASSNEKEMEFIPSSLDNSLTSLLSDEPVPRTKEGIPGLDLEPVKAISIDKHKEITHPESLNLSRDIRTLNEKPKLLQTLQNVLECLSQNMSGCNIKNTPLKEYTELKPPLPLESCLKIYKYLHGEAKFINNNNLNSGTSEFSTLSSIKVDASVVDTGDNFEVMDMECDSEDET